MLRASPALIVLSLALTAPTRAECPDPSELRRAIAALDLGRSARATRFASPMPAELYEQAVRDAGHAAAARDGDRAFGVLVSAVPVEVLWKALNDEDHHALGGRYVPVRHSEVIGGVPRGPSRLLFQYLERLGIGRWWVSRVSMNRELYESTGGRFWELLWQDEMDTVDRSRPPVDTVSARMPGIRSSRGSWLLVELAEGCTLVEYFTWTDPGGAVGAAQLLFAKRGVRETIEGIVKLADEHVTAPHDGPGFVRPDGSALE